MDFFIDYDKLEAIKARILANTHTRNDLLDLLDLVDDVQDKLDEFEAYVIEESELQDVVLDDNGALI
jgi:hypothetical protein